MALEELASVELHSVSDTIDFVKSSAIRMYHRNTNAMSLYRGQSNYTWHLEPGVYRDNHFQFESVYIKELERIRPLEFANYSNFEKLVKMQHYGLPTRLLDVTSNPLVALYFACESQFETDGAFYYFSTPTFWEDNWAVQIVTDYIMEPTNYLNDFVSKEILRLPEVLKNSRDAFETVFHSLAVPAHAILPKKSNQRIQQQSGAFLLFGMSYNRPTPNEYRSDYIQYCKLNMKEEESICPIIKKIRIPAQYKRSILEELDLLNINKGVLFPELEYQAKNVVQYVSQKLCFPKKD